MSLERKNMKHILFMLNNYRLSEDMSGIGLRMLEIAQVLSGHCNITIYSNIPSDIRLDNINLVSCADNKLEHYINICDAVVSTDIPDMEMLLYAYKLDKQIVIENSIPIEHLFYSEMTSSMNIDEKYNQLIMQFYFQLIVADIFIARSFPEEQTLIACLALVGRLNTYTYTNEGQFSDLISKIPIGFNNFSETHRSEHCYNTTKDEYECDLLWSGGIWDYLNPNMIIDALNILPITERPKIHFLYKPPSDQYINAYEELKNRIEKDNISNIAFIDNIIHSKRDIHIEKAKALICVGKNTLENKTCHRLRLRDCFLYKKPIIVDRYGATGLFVQANNIGLTVNNANDLTDAIKILMHDNNKYAELVSSIESIREQYLIENNIGHLLNAISMGKRAEDIRTNKWKEKISSFISKHNKLFISQR